MRHVSCINDWNEEGYHSSMSQHRILIPMILIKWRYVVVWFWFQENGWWSHFIAVLFHFFYWKMFRYFVFPMNNLWVRDHRSAKPKCYYKENEENQWNLNTCTCYHTTQGTINYFTREKQTNKNEEIETNESEAGKRNKTSYPLIIVCCVASLYIFSFLLYSKHNVFLSSAWYNHKHTDMKNKWNEITILFEWAMG